jgi:hypothetical protein
MKISGWETEWRTCGECKNIRVNGDVHFCPKKMMMVIPNLYVMFPTDKGSCFESRQTGEGAQ